MILRELGQHKQEIQLLDGRKALFSYQTLTAVYLPVKEGDQARLFVSADLYRAPLAVARHVKEWMKEHGFEAKDVENRSKKELSRIIEGGLRA